MKSKGSHEWAFDTHDRDLIASALKDAEAARCFLGDTPVMLSTHLLVRHVAIKIGFLTFSDELLSEARSMSGTMAHLPFGRLELAWFLEDFGDRESADRIWADADSISGYEAITCMACLLNSTTPEGVLRIMDRRVDSSDLYAQCNRAGIMALIPAMHEEARRLCEEQLRRPGTYDVRNVFLTVLLLLGHPDDAAASAEELLATSECPFRYQKECMCYTAGRLSAEDLIRDAGNSRINQSAAFLQIAMMELANGNRDQAETYFRKCVEVGLFVDGNYWWSKRYLEIMNEAPDWPSWIRAR